MSRPVRRPGAGMLFAGSRQSRLAAALASGSPFAYVMIRCSSPRLVARALAEGGHTTRFSRRAARLCAARAHRSGDSADITRQLVPHAETPRVLARLYASLGEHADRSFSLALRRHPGSDEHVLWLLGELPANIGAAFVVSVSEDAKRYLVTARYGSDTPLEKATTVLAAAACFAHDASFSDVIKVLDRFSELDPSGAWGSLLVSELSELGDTPSATLAAACEHIVNRLTSLGSQLATAAKMRQAGAPATLDELEALVALDLAAGTGISEPAVSEPVAPR